MFCIECVLLPCLVCGPCLIYILISCSDLHSYLVFWFTVISCVLMYIHVLCFDVHSSRVFLMYIHVLCFDSRSYLVCWSTFISCVLTNVHLLCSDLYLYLKCLLQPGVTFTNVHILCSEIYIQILNVYCNPASLCRVCWPQITAPPAPLLLMGLLERPH